MGMMRCPDCKGTGEPAAGAVEEYCVPCNGSGSVWDGERERDPNRVTFRETYEEAHRLKREVG